MDGRNIEPRKVIWAVAEITWKDDSGTSFRVPAVLEDTSRSGACVRLKRPLAVGSRITIEWHRGAVPGYRAELPNLELSLRERLMKERLRFNVILDDNMNALDLAQNSTKRLINRILEAARLAVVDEKQTNYSNGGKAMAYKSASMSINIDQSL